MNKDKITVIGSINYDLIFKQKRLPLKGETYTADELISSPGGKGANQAAQCAKLGLNTYMVAKAGQDGFGSECIRSLQSFGVNCDYVWKSDAKTGLGCLHLLPDGDYYSTIFTGANFQVTPEDIKKAELLLAESRIVILQMEIPTNTIEYAIELAKKNGCYVILNLAPPKDIRTDVLKKADCLIVNETEASFLTKAAIISKEDALRESHLLLSRIGDLLIITLGIKGSIACNHSQQVFEPTNGQKAIDATGAGDSFIGAVAYCIFHQIRDIETILRFATYVSSISITKYGGQESFPYLNELLRASEILSK